MKIAPALLRLACVHRKTDEDWPRSPSEKDRRRPSCASSTAQGARGPLRRRDWARLIGICDGCRLGSQRLQVPAAILITLLQRGPVSTLIQTAEQILSEPPSAVFLKLAVASAASLGAMHTLAGATTYALVSTQPSPLSVTVNAAIPSVGFTVTNTIYTGSWMISGQVPPGLQFSAVEGGNTLTGPGILDATTAGMSDGYGGMTGGNSQTTPVLSGTPTLPGTYQISLTAYEYGAAGGLVSPTYAYSVTVKPAVAAPSITTQPVSQTVGAGSTLTLTVAATGSPTYQWQLGGNNLSNSGNISGSQTSTLTITNIATSQAGNYTVVATNAGGSVTSSAAAVTVSYSGPPPFITTQPTGQSVNAGASPTLSVAATNAASYQWQFNGANIPGATNATLALSNIGSTQRGSYAAVATNPAGSVSSNAVNVAVSVNSFLYNISTLGYVGPTTSQSLVGGFYTTGSGSKNVVVRGIGPNLAVVQPSLNGLALATPSLTLYNATSAMGTNTAWGGGQTLTNAFNTVFAPVFATNSNDTAFFVDVPAGPGIGYTAQIAGASGATGVAQIEVYDYDSYVGTPASRLVNISTRGYVGASGGLSIATGISRYQYLDAGFYVIGNTAQTLLIRAVGPGEAGAFPGQNLANAKLTLYDSSGNIIATNSGWGNSPVLGNSTVAAGIQPATTAIMNSVYAGAIAAGSNDSAMVATLPTGTSGVAGYTATVTSADGTAAGIALVEVYNVP